MTARKYQRELTSHDGKINYLLESIDELNSTTNPRRKIFLVLMYWKVFDGIDIPAEVLQDILKKGTNPETILRRARNVTVSRRSSKGEQENDQNS